jgi:phosphonate metabolism protein PhnN/1,5-bisphosphokinase (PRPP-forming)
MTRYALYFSPPPDSPWWPAACRWLGRDPITGAEFSQKPIPGVSHLQLAKLTSDARRYGFHATLKAPFRLKSGFTESSLHTMAEAFCASQRPIDLVDMQVRQIGDFLALRPSGPHDAIHALAARCVNFFDLLRAPLSSPELARRRQSGLTARQEVLLGRWGYPYTEEEFRFHMTLTDALPSVSFATFTSVRDAAEEHFSPARIAAPLTLDALTVFREDHAGAPFSVLRRFPFLAQGQDSALPTSGRLFFFVGPSGVGKDTLLQWVRARVPADAGLVFAQRTITRPAGDGESHESVDDATFLKLYADGCFAMTWRANGLQYGIRRVIESDLRAGWDVVVNGSREYVPRLQKLYPDAQIIWVEADVALIRKRVEIRKRETGAALLHRINRITQFAPPPESKVIRLENSGAVDLAGHQLLEILTRHRQTC